MVRVGWTVSVAVDTLRVQSRNKKGFKKTIAMVMVMDVV